MNAGAQILALRDTGKGPRCWCGGKDVEFQRGMESTAYLNGEARLDEAGRRRTSGAPAGVISAEGSADRTAAFKTGAQELIQLQEAGVGDAVIALMVEKSAQK